MRLLHLSDVHFHGAAHGWDEDEDQRTQIVIDVRIEVAANGSFDALLFGGDIAFSALAEEYRLATLWLDELIEAAGLDGRHKVFTVPGNHDVDRNVIGASQSLQDFRSALRDSNLPGIDETLRSRMSADPAAPSVFAHLDAYNEFAEQYVCAVTPAKPAWTYSGFELDGWKVRLIGLTSVINCGPNNESAVEGQQTLVLGSQQCRMSRNDADVSIVMMHHPPEWIRDWSTVQAHLSRAHVWLFGHEHAFGAKQAVLGGTVQIRAGAVAPERTVAGEEAPYLPAFNFIELSRDGDKLQVSVRANIWDIELTRYQVRDRLLYEVALDPMGSSAEECQQSEVIDESMSASPLSMGAGPDRAVEETLNKVGGQSPDLRKVAVSFMSLPTNRRNEVARNLGVLSDEDLTLFAAELYPLLLRRIAEHDLIAKLIEELQA